MDAIFQAYFILLLVLFSDEERADWIGDVMSGQSPDFGAIRSFTGGSGCGSTKSVERVSVLGRSSA